MVLDTCLATHGQHYYHKGFLVAALEVRFGIRFCGENGTRYTIWSSCLSFRRVDVDVLFRQWDSYIKPNLGSQNRVTTHHDEWRSENFGHHQSSRMSYIQMEKNLLSFILLNLPYATHHDEWRSENPQNPKLHHETANRSEWASVTMGITTIIWSPRVMGGESVRSITRQCLLSLLDRQSTQSTVTQFWAWEGKQLPTPPDDACHRREDSEHRCLRNSILEYQRGINHRH
jgi:hypothetical protein